MLQKLLEMKLSQAVQEQLRAGVGAVPKEHADELLTEVAQLDATKIRGLIVIVASDLEDPHRGQGIAVQTLVAGPPATLPPLDRKSGLSGKSVSGRVHLGGRRN